MVRPAGLAELRLPVPDRPGVLAEVTTLAGATDVNIADLEIAHSSEGDRGVLILLVEAAAVERLRSGLVELGYRPSRSEERRVGQECVSKCRSRWSTYH